jgi:hypothetical protein
MGWVLIYVIWSIDIHRPFTTFMHLVPTVLSVMVMEVVPNFGNLI